MGVDNLLEQCRIDIAYLEHELLTIHSHRKLWRAVVDAIGERIGPNVPRLWPDHYTMLYVSAQSSAVRRLVRGTKEQICWTTLLRRVERESDGLTMERLLENAGGQGVPQAILQFETEWLHNWFDSTGAFRSQQPHLDRSDLLMTSKRVIALVDRSIAHIYKPMSGAERPTFDDLEAAITKLTDVHRRYRRLITGVDYDASSIMMESGWTNVFERPLFDSAWADSS